MKNILKTLAILLLLSSCATSLKQELKILQEENKAINQKLDSLLTDIDEDGVSNYFDLQNDTPLGARTDGHGYALDTDLDGIIDLYDKCVTVPGIVQLEGCPEVDIKEDYPYSCGQNIEFEKNSIKLNKNAILFIECAAEIIIKRGKGKTFIIEGHSDASGNANLNMRTSLLRAKKVRAELVELGVDINQLEVVAKGSSDLLYTECNPASKCTEDKNQANRRVIFKMKE